MNKLRENKGEFTVKGAVMLLLSSIILVLSITVIGTVNSMARLHGVADQMARYISIRGVIDDSVTQEQERLISDSGLDCTVSVSAEYIGGTKQIQFGSPFTVTVKYPTKFGIGGIVSVPVTLSSRAEGRSEIYWK